MASIRERYGASGITYQVTWRDGQGKQCARTTGSKREAAKIKKQAESLTSLMQRGANPDLYSRDSRITGDRTRPSRPHQNREGRPTVAGYAERFLATWRLSDSGRACYRLIIRKYLVPSFPGAMMDVTTADVRAFWRYLEGENKSGDMIRKVRSCGSSMWQLAMDDDKSGVTDNPWLHAGKIKPVVKKAKPTMTVRDYELVRDNISPHYRLIVVTLAETGLRWGEAMRLQPSDIIGQMLHVRQSKSGKPRSLKISAELADELRGALPFRSTRGSRVIYQVFRRNAWDPTVLGMNGHEGIPFTPHSLRHAHASWLLATSPRPRVTCTRCQPPGTRRLQRSSRRSASSGYAADAHRSFGSQYAVPVTSTSSLIASLVSSLAWPVAVVILAGLIFRRQVGAIFSELAKKMKDLTKVKAPGTEFSFADNLISARTDLQALTFSTNFLSASTHSAWQALARESADRPLVSVEELLLDSGDSGAPLEVSDDDPLIEIPKGHSITSDDSIIVDRPYKARTLRWPLVASLEIGHEKPLGHLADQAEASPVETVRSAWLAVETSIRLLARILGMGTDASHDGNFYGFAASVLTNAKLAGAATPDIGTQLSLIQKLWDNKSQVLNGNQRISKLEAFDYATTAEQTAAVIRRAARSLTPTGAVPE
jgi:integrase